VGLLGGCLLTLSLQARPPEPAPIPKPSPDLYVRKVLAILTAQDAHQPDGATFFLGDSLTQGLAVDAVTEQAVNYGIAHLTAERLARESHRFALDGRVVLMIGTNDLLRGQDPRPALRRLSQLPGPLVWHAIPPSDRFDPSAVNAEIRQLCALRADCTYVETAFGPEDFTDGVHLSASGQGKLIASLRSALE
jgi:lysophospholipase L1-like esterase